MGVDTLYLNGTYLARHPHDNLQVSKERLAAIENIASALFRDVTNRYGSSERWIEMDRFWAGQQANLMIQGTPYVLFAPGKFYTYDTLADVVQTALEETGTPIKDAKVGEIGCGNATWSLILGNRGAKPFLFDKSWSGLNFAEYLANESHFNVDIAESRQGDFYDLPAEWKVNKGILDVVVSGAVVEHLNINDQNRYLNQIFEVLKPGGLLVFTMPNLCSPSNISSDIKRKKVYDQVKQTGDYKYTIDLPMAYNKEGGKRDMGDMLRKNNFVPQKVGDAVLIAPSTPLERNIVDSNPVAKRVYDSIERMCRSEFITSTGLTPTNVETMKSLMDFWKIQSQSLTDQERSQIGRWLYAVGRKPYK